MKSVPRTLLCAVALLTAAPAAPLAAQQPAQQAQPPQAQSRQQDPFSSDLFRRMTQVNAGLKSYEARMRVDVSMKSFPYLSPTLSGNIFYKQPDKQAIVFDTVPALASQFKKVYPRLESPSQWPAIYTVARIGDANGATTFRLIPRKSGRVEHLDVKVDDATATVTAYTWTYKDGGYIAFDQTFTTVGGNYLVKSQTGHVEIPSYKADVASAFSDYKLNVAISDSVFSSQ
jgi:outer membrane lipoprotein-sorting protein